MRKRTALMILILLLPLVLRGVSAQKLDSGSILSVSCQRVKVTGAWDEGLGFYAKIDGSCPAFLRNPFNVSLMYGHTGWYGMNVIPSTSPEIDIRYPSLSFSKVWIKPGGVLKGNTSVEGRVFRLGGLVTILRSKTLFITGTGHVVLLGREKNGTMSRYMDFGLEMNPVVEVEWESVLVVLSVLLFPFLWIVFGLLMGVINRKDEGKARGWAIFASYGVLAMVIWKVIYYLNPKTQLVATVSVESLLLTVWLSAVNRTTPNKPDRATKLLGNAVLFFMGLSVLTALLGGYLEGSLAVAGGIIFLGALSMGAFQYYLKDIVGEEEKQGRIPELAPLPPGLALVLFPYPSLIVFWLVGWEEGVIALIITAFLLFALGLSLTRKAERSGKGFYSV